MVDPGDHVVFRRQTHEMTVECLSKQFGLIDPEFISPSLRLSGLQVVDPETDHRHT